MRKQILCSFPVRNLIIKLSPARSTIKQEDVLAAKAAAHIHTIKLTSGERYVSHFFSIFLPQDTFSQRLTASSTAIQTNLVLHESTLDIVAAIGALHCAYKASSDSRSLTHDALRLYSHAINTLVLEIIRSTQEDLPSLLWSSFFLGLFEVGLVCTGIGRVRALAICS